MGSISNIPFGLAIRNHRLPFEHDSPNSQQMTETNTSSRTAIHHYVLARQHMEDGWWQGDISSSLYCAGFRDATPGYSDESLFPFVKLHSSVTSEQCTAMGERSVMTKKVLKVFGPPHTDDEMDLAKTIVANRAQINEQVSTAGSKNGNGFSLQRVMEHVKMLRGNQEMGANTATDMVFQIHLLADAVKRSSWTALLCQILQNGGCADVVARYSLKTRSFLGPTTLASELSLMMANLALADSTTLVLDPFFGTGGGLVGCAHFGAKMVGWEIDWRILHGGRSPNETFDQYSLPRPEIVRGDFSTEGRCMREADVCVQLFDAIIADPPYGIRAGARKTGKIAEDRPPIPQQHLGTHIPQTRKYDGEDVVKDLIDAAAILLKTKGRLVYLHPFETVVWEKGKVGGLPTHPFMKVIYAGCQVIRGGMCRVLVTMERVEGDAAAASAISATTTSDNKRVKGNCETA